jgi:rhodanese-related sulfurtransferase
MTMADGRESSRDTPKTIGGALALLVVGVALGIGWNAMGLASKSARGLPWIAPPRPTRSVESLQPVVPPDTMVTPAPGLATAPGPDVAMVRAVPAASQRATTAAKPLPALTPAVTPPRATATIPPPTRAAVATPRRAAAPDSAHSLKAAPPTPAADVPKIPAAAAPAPVAELPVIPDVTGPLTVELAAFKRLYDAGAALVVDAREPGLYDQGHVAGAVSLPYNSALADPSRVARLDAGSRPIVVYCGGAQCELALDLAKFLVESGKRKVLVFEGGYHEWQGAGYPLEHGPAAGAHP